MALQPTVAVCPAGLQSQSLAAAAKLLPYSDLRQRTVCCFIRSLHHKACLGCVCHEIWIQHKDCCSWHAQKCHMLSSAVQELWGHLCCKDFIKVPIVYLGSVCSSLILHAYMPIKIKTFSSICSSGGMILSAVLVHAVTGNFPIWKSLEQMKFLANWLQLFRLSPVLYLKTIKIFFCVCIELYLFLFESEN